jgi:hypothetical protein
MKGKIRDFLRYCENTDFGKNTLSKKESAFSNLSENVTAGVRTVRSFVDDYYSSSQDSKGLKSLDSYCDLFRRRMAILMIAPILLSMKMTGISDFTIVIRN